MNPLLALAAVLAAVAGVPMLLLAKGGRNTRGENLMGLHLVVIPLALACTAATLLSLLVQGVTPTWLAAATWTAMPGHAVAVLVALFACYGARHRRLAKLLVVGAVLTPALAIAGPLLGPWGVPAAAGLTLAYGGTATALVALRVLGRRARRWLPRRRSRGADGLEVGSFEAGQAAFERERWARLPPDASVATLLGFVRAFDPAVRERCLQMLAAHPDLEQGLDQALRTADDDNAPHYLAHHGPQPRAGLAAALVERLDRLRADAQARLRQSTEPRPYLGDFVGTLEAGIAVLRDGGDVRDALHRWAEFLQTVPTYQALAKQLLGHLRRADRRRG